jgi:nickel-dependent lactate racemase
VESISNGGRLVDHRPPLTFGTAAAAPNELAATDLRAVVRAALERVQPGTRVLAIVPDKTRDDNSDVLFPIISEELAARGAASLDALIAQGTHPPMTDAEKRAKIGVGTAPLPLLGGIFDHHWDRPAELVALGRMEAAEVAALTGDLMARDVPIQLNARLAPGRYDLALVVGGVVPHEVAGFAGGAKYFFPGVAGPELTHLTHWLGALATIERVIGRVETPTRRVIEAAADRLPVPVIAFTSVSTRPDNRLHTHALFAGELRETVRRAAAVSAQVHVRYTARRYKRVLALLDERYDELWVGGKASYKLGGIIEDGGELIIYAPHLSAISTTHGRLIEKYGYAPLEQVRDMVEESDELRANLCVAAHLAHVAYAGRVGADGSIEPRYRITLASSLPEETVKRVRLSYSDWHTMDIEAARRDPETLVVEHAGRDLYLVA